MQFDWRDSERQIKAFAYKVLLRLRAAGAASHTLEDVEQELWVAWCKACETYDPSYGATFSTYLHRGMRQHINRYVYNNVDRRHEEVIAVSLDKDPTDSGDTTLGEIIPSADPTPEDEVVQRSLIEKSFGRLSPRSRAFLRILSEQPDEILAEVQAVIAKSDYAKANGYVMPVSRRLTSSMIFDLMDATRTERRAILSELQSVAQSHMD